MPYKHLFNDISKSTGGKKHIQINNIGIQIRYNKIIDKAAYLKLYKSLKKKSPYNIKK